MSRRHYAQSFPDVVANLIATGTTVVYYAQPGLAYPPNCLVVDYDQVALDMAKPPLSACGELADLNGPVPSVVVNLPSHVPVEQSRYDLHLHHVFLVRRDA